MAINNTLTNTQNKKEKMKFSVALQTDAYQNLINTTLTDHKRASRFIASISSAVAVNPSLQECEAASIFTAALMGESLGLSPSPQMGQFYMVPFSRKEKKDKKTGKITPEALIATFQLGYKGYIQLAMRSGMYKTMNVVEVKNGELQSFDKLTEDAIIQWKEDGEREKLETTGYIATLGLVKGFKKTIYWSKQKMLYHANKYSSSFNGNSYKDLLSGKIPQSELWKYSSLWYVNFDEMAFKTMLRQLISKWGIMSVEMQEAFVKDMAEIKEDGTFEYVDNDSQEINLIEQIEEERVQEETEPTEEPTERLGFNFNT